MKVLHINVSAICDKFYLDFFEALRQRGIEQDVFVPFDGREYSVEEQNNIVQSYKMKEVRIKTLPIKTVWDRVFYYKKIRKYVSALKKEFVCSDFILLHAHSLYSDGGVAYQFFKEYKIPYIVAVRTTDTEFFMKYYKWLSLRAKAILSNAARIVFISTDLKYKTIKLLYKNRTDIDWLDRCTIIPNGVNDFWLENRYKSKLIAGKNQINILQVSRLNRRKNVDKSILAIKELLSREINVQLFVAGEGRERDSLEALIRDNGLEKSVKLIGFLSERSDMLKLYRESDIFLMPSEGETFGISYIEALTQGLPVIGLKKTGVSAYFKDKEVGEFLETASPSVIADAIERIMQNYEQISKNCIYETEQFDWKNITNLYIEMYDEVKMNCN